MPCITESTIQSFQKLGLQLIDLIPVECRNGYSKWQKRGVQLQKIAAELQQDNTQKTQVKAQTLIDRVSGKLKGFCRQVESEPLKLIKKEIKCLSRQFRQDLLPEGVLFDGKIYIISEQLLEADSEVFWQAITGLSALNDRDPSPQIKIGNFIYEMRDLLAQYKTFPLHELATSVRCSLKREEEKELSKAQARLLLKYPRETEMPNELNLSDVDPISWNIICQFVILGKKNLELSSDQQDRLQNFLLQFQSDLLPIKFKQLAEHPILTISSDSLSLPKEQFRNEMKQLLDKCSGAQVVELRLGYGSVPYVFHEISYRLSIENFRRLLDDPTLDPTFKFEREMRVIWNNNPKETISLLEMRILLRKNPWDDLPEQLEVSDISHAYLSCLLQLAWPSRGGPLEICHLGLKVDELHYLLLFLSKHHPNDYNKFVEENYTNLAVRYSNKDGSIVNLSNSFFQISRLGFEKFTEFLLETYKFDTVAIDLGRQDLPYKMSREQLTRLLNNPQFRPADLLSNPTVLLSDDQLHEVPFLFYHEILPNCPINPGPNPYGSKKSPNLNSGSLVLYDAIYWFNRREMPSSSFERIEAVVLFFQDWAPESPYTIAAQKYLLNIKVTPMANYSTWEEIEEWLAPYNEAAPKNAVQMGQNGLIYSRAFISRLAKEKKVPLSFLSRIFYFRFHDGSLGEMDISFLYLFWESFKATFEKNPDAFASKENPLAFGLSLDPLRSKYGVADLLCLRLFLHPHILPHYCQIVRKFLPEKRCMTFQVPDMIYSQIENTVSDKGVLDFYIENGKIRRSELDRTIMVQFRDKKIVKLPRMLLAFVPAHQIGGLSSAEFNDLCRKLFDSTNGPWYARSKYAKYMLITIGAVAVGAIALAVTGRTEAIRSVFTATAYENGFAPTRVQRVWTFVMQKTNSIFAPLYTAIRTLFGLTVQPYS